MDSKQKNFFIKLTLGGVVLWILIIIAKATMPSTYYYKQGYGGVPPTYRVVEPDVEKDSK